MSSVLSSLSPTVSLTKHTDRQRTYNLTGALLGLLRDRDDVRGAVEPRMSWLLATVFRTSSNFPPPLLRIAAVVLGYSNTNGNTLTSYTLTTILLLKDSAAGLVRN